MKCHLLTLWVWKAAHFPIARHEKTGVFRVILIEI